MLSVARCACPGGGRRDASCCGKSHLNGGPQIELHRTKTGRHVRNTHPLTARTGAAPLVPLPIPSSVAVPLVLQARCSAQDDRAETARQGGIRSLAF